MNNYRIELTGPGKGRVWRDGEEMKGVTSVEVKAAVNCANEVRLTFIADSVVVEGDLLEVTCMTDEARAFVPAKPVEVR